ALQQGTEAAAGPAPGGPEVDDDRHGPGALQDVLGEGGLGDVDDHAGVLPQSTLDDASPQGPRAAQAEVDEEEELMSSTSDQTSRKRSGLCGVSSSTARRGSSQSWQTIQMGPGCSTLRSRRCRRPQSSQVMVMRMGVVLSVRCGEEAVCAGPAPRAVCAGERLPPHPRKG